MARLPRKTQKVFGSGLTVAGNVAVFGSLAAGAPAYSADPAVIQSLAQFLNGLTGGVVGNNSPAIQDLNALFLLATQQIAYILQLGMQEWDSGTEYTFGSFAQDGSGVLYVSLRNANLNHALSDTNWWQPYAARVTGVQTARAWVTFDGINVVGPNSILKAAYNVSTVTKNLAGSYTVNFTTPLPSANYVLSGFCGSSDGQAYGAGDDGLVVGNVTGQGVAVRSAASCRVFTINPTNKALVEPGDVSVIFFG